MLTLMAPRWKHDFEQLRVSPSQVELYGAASFMFFGSVEVDSDRGWDSDSGAEWVRESGAVLGTITYSDFVSEVQGTYDPSPPTLFIIKRNREAPRGRIVYS